MMQSAAAHAEGRPPRTKLGGAVLVLLRLENGRNIRAQLQQVSVTGGLLRLEHPLDEGIKVEIMFHVGTCTVRCRAAMLFPMWATQGCMQPFQFTEISADDQQKLGVELQGLREQGASAVSFP